MSTNDPTAVVDALADVWGSMQRLGAELDEAQWKLPTDCPGWTVQDNLAHIIGIESVILGRPEPDGRPSRSAAREERPRALERDLGRVVPFVVGCGGARAVPRDGRAAARHAAIVHRGRLVGAVVDARRRPGTVRDLIPFRVLDSWIHELDMRRALGRPANMESPPARLALGRLRGVLGMIVGARLRPPDGTRVAFVVEGPGGFVEAYAMQDAAPSRSIPFPSRSPSRSTRRCTWTPTPSCASSAGAASSTRSRADGARRGRRQPRPPRDRAHEGADVGAM